MVIEAPITIQKLSLSYINKLGLFFVGEKSSPTTSNKQNKKIRPKSQSQKKSKNKFMSADSSQPSLVELEERLCPVEGCNSNGHLSGHLEKHFTIDACPLYHNLTPKQCKVSFTRHRVYFLGNPSIHRKTINYETRSSYFVLFYFYYWSSAIQLFKQSFE